MPTRSGWIGGLGLAAALALALAAPAAGAAQIASNLVTVTTGAGTISLASRLFDEAPGDPSRWLFEYELTGDWNPVAGSTNGISSLQLLFGGLFDDLADRTAPSGWDLDSTIAQPPFGVGFDRAGPDYHVGPPFDLALFSFTVPAGTPWSQEDFGSLVGSHEDFVPTDLLPLVDDLGGYGPLVPVPESDSLAPVALGLAALARRRR